MLERCMEFILEKVILPFFVVLLCGMLLGGLGFTVYVWWQYAFPNEQDEQRASITDRYWVCTHAHREQHPAREGMLTRFGRMSEHPQWTETLCDAWSSKMIDGTHWENGQWVQDALNNTRRP